MVIFSPLICLWREQTYRIQGKKEVSELILSRLQGMHFIGIKDRLIQCQFQSLRGQIDFSFPLMPQAIQQSQLKIQAVCKATNSACQFPQPKRLPKVLTGFLTLTPATHESVSPSRGKSSYNDDYQMINSLLVPIFFRILNPQGLILKYFLSRLLVIFNRRINS